MNITNAHLEFHEALVKDAQEQLKSTGKYDPEKAFDKVEVQEACTTLQEQITKPVEKEHAESERDADEYNQTLESIDRQLKNDTLRKITE